MALPGASPGSAHPGLHPLGLRPDRDPLLYIPESSQKREKAPLIVSLQGANRNADHRIDRLRSLSDEQQRLVPFAAVIMDSYRWRTREGPVTPALGVTI